MKQEKNIWEQSRVELFQKLDCRETGLSQEDAADRLAKYGANELHAGKQKSVLQIFLGQFADFLVLILILAAVISACMGDVEIIFNGCKVWQVLPFGMPAFLCIILYYRKLLRNVPELL